jgi:RND family efflux transporter MFP subunit
LLFLGCHSQSTLPTGKSAGESHSPSKVEKIPVETEIARITLTPEATQRLGITTADVTLKDATRRRTFGGDITIPSGKSIIVAAPFSGAIVPPRDKGIPTPGQRVTLGEPLLSINPLLTPERDVPTPVERVQIANAKATLLSALTVAEGDVERTTAEVEAAKIARDRAAKLLEDRVGSARAMDDAQAILNVAEANLVAANERKQQLAQLAITLDSPSGTSGDATPLAVTAPQAGFVRTLSVTPGQTVTIGAPLFELVSTDTVWIRVPVYVDLLDTIETGEPATIVGLDGRKKESTTTATPIEAPPSADPLSSTADLFFVADNGDGSLRPGQRIGVELKLRGSEQALSVPAKSLLYDIYGGTWVYEQTAENVYERRRVLVRFTDGDDVILAEGLSTGMKVVVDGAAELYGTEFGSGK